MTNQISPTAIQPNQLDVLKAVENFRYLTVPQVQALFDLNYTQAKNLLFHLWRSDLLVRLILTKASSEVSYSYVFALSANGARHLTLNIGKGKWFCLKKKSERSIAFLEHELLINDFRVCLELLTKEKSQLHLTSWKQSKDEVKLYFNEF